MISDRRDIANLLDHAPVLLRLDEVKAALKYRAHAGYGLWFWLYDGRVFDERGRPAFPVDMSHPWIGKLSECD